LVAPELACALGRGGARGENDRSPLDHGLGEGGEAWSEEGQEGGGGEGKGETHGSVKQINPS
jgi:hypothetical protein